MWTSKNRGRYDRSRLRYPSNLTDEEWALVEPVIPPAKRGGNRRHVVVRDVVNGLMYILSTACVVCGRTPAEAHHIGFAQPRALGRKVSDEYTVPVCRLHHRELHRYGDEASWWAGVNVDPLPIALDLWRSSQSVEKEVRSLGYSINYRRTINPKSMLVSRLDRRRAIRISFELEAVLDMTREQARPCRPLVPGGSSDSGHGRRIQAVVAVMTAIPALCATAGRPTPNALLIADRGKSDAVIVLSPQAGRFERQAAEDLAKYIKVMTGAFVPILITSDVSDAAD